jgi:hypothetical protein
MIGVTPRCHLVGPGYGIHTEPGTRKSLSVVR